MNEYDRIRIKNKMIAQSRWWGDDFDVRFYLLSKVSTIKNSIILDVGGGIGIILSEMNSSNTKINVDLSFADLKTCKTIDPKIHNICASMTNLPFKNAVFDIVICSHLLEVAKTLDLNLEKERTSPIVQTVLKEIHRVLNSTGKYFITTQNNAYFKTTTRLTYNELKLHLDRIFSNFQILFYNTYPRISSRYRKLNFANTIPKVKSRILRRSILDSLCKTKSKNNYSVTFYIEGKM
jgi:ubiquinone/menaquinone biosynthesis C-methylase UbiE